MITYTIYRDDVPVLDTGKEARAQALARALATQHPDETITIRWHRDEDGQVAYLNPAGHELYVQPW